MPLTEQPVYYPSCLENSPPGTKIIQLNATDDDKDPDQKISYRLISGNPEGFFSINTTTGTGRELSEQLWVARLCNSWQTRNHTSVKCT